MKIVRGVYKVEGIKGCGVYIVEGEDHLTLVDTGMAGATKKVFQTIAAIGHKPEDLKEIVVTHYHGDHTGSLTELAEATGAQVCVHALDAPVVRGEESMPSPKMPRLLSGLLGPLLVRLARPPKPSRVDRELQDSDELGVAGLRVVHVPGHTPGQIALHMPSRGVLFVGDAVVNVLGLRPPPGMFTQDKAQARESIRKLAALECDIVCFGHGPVLMKAGSTRLRRFAKGLR
ncbi:MAG: MBL fold metallo-hydrolase [Dehalococcoidia bacterium]